MWERFWRPPALPGAHSYQGVRGESNPPLRRSQRRVPHRYTTDTISQRKERESNPQGRVRAPPLSGRFPSPIGWPFRKSSRVDSNHRSSPCRGAVLAAERRDGLAPRAGVEPATSRSKREMMSISPSGQFFVSTQRQQEHLLALRAHEYITRRKARDSNPHLPCGRAALAVRSGQPYPAAFRFSGPTGNRTRIADMPSRHLPVGPWAREAFHGWGQARRRPHHALSDQATAQEVTRHMAPFFAAAENSSEPAFLGQDGNAAGVGRFKFPATHLFVALTQ